jgi:hypothetical protein
MIPGVVLIAAMRDKKTVTRAFLERLKKHSFVTETGNNLFHSGLDRIDCDVFKFHSVFLSCKLCATDKRSA